MISGMRIERTGEDDISGDDGVIWFVFYLTEMIGFGSRISLKLLFEISFGVCNPHKGSYV